MPNWSDDEGRPAPDSPLLKRRRRVRTVRASAPPKVAWEKARPLSRRYCHFDVWGESGTGRSYLAATAPGPAAVIDIDQNFDRVLGSFDLSKFKVAPILYAVTSDNKKNAEICTAAWKKLEAYMEDASGWAKSTLVDTETEMWALIRLAMHGTETPKGKRMDALWGPTNARMNRMLRLWRGAKNNLITVGMAGDIYKEKADGTSSKTGKQERKGFSRLPYFMDVSVRTYIDEDGDFCAELMVNKFDMGMIGLVFTGDELNFAAIMATCTNTEPEEWE